ncbi:MAG: glutathione S-transferase family protein [Candidatus Contendobacter sp.]|nr:glutathione S-transferase family protein [Candidatus Contendobacter sp.]
MLTVYGCANTRSSRVLWALEEAGAEYEYVAIDLRAGAGWKPEYLALNPGGKVPTLVDGGLVLTESAAICTYIGDRFPASRLTPPVGSPERAHYDQWCYFALSELEQPLWTLAKHLFALPERRRVPAVLDTARWEFAVAVKILALGLGQREFIVGDHFTAADILMAHTLAWASAFKLPLEHDHLVTYTERLLARPAWARVQKRERAERD